MPLPRRWLTALMTRYNGSSLMIDCGEGTQVAIKEKGWSFKPIDVICFTHYHADHISGLPGMLLTMGNAERTEPLTLKLVVELLEEQCQHCYKAFESFQMLVQEQEKAISAAAAETLAAMAASAKS